MIVDTKVVCMNCGHKCQSDELEFIGGDRRCPVWNCGSVFVFIDSEESK